MSHDTLLVILGASLALVSGLIGAFLNHYFSLRMDKTIRKRNLTEKDASELAQVIPEEVAAFVSTLGERSLVPEIESFKASVYIALVNRMKWLLNSGLLTTVQHERINGELARIEFLSKHQMELQKWQSDQESQAQL